MYQSLVSRLPRFTGFVFVDSWAAPPASAGLKTLLPVPTFEGESLFVVVMFVSLFSDGTQQRVGEDNKSVLVLASCPHSLIQSMCIGNILYAKQFSEH